MLISGFLVCGISVLLDVVVLFVALSFYTTAIMLTIVYVERFIVESDKDYR